VTIAKEKNAFRTSRRDHTGSNRFLFIGSEWSVPGSRDIDGRAERPRERERASQWLKDVAVYDFRNRMYQPELGRFIQPDPKEFKAGDYNLYRYCHNDPINKSDPTGEFVTFGKGWTEADIQAFQAQFAKEWADPAGHEHWMQAYASSAEIRITPTHGFFGNNSGFKVQAFDDKGHELRLTFTRDDKAPSVAAQGSGNFKKNPQGDNTAANKEAFDAAREGGIGAGEKELLRKFHNFDKSEMTFQQMKELAADIKTNPGNYH
jgi:RHS repeat-associated protein